MRALGAKVLDDVRRKVVKEAEDRRTVEVPSKEEEEEEEEKARKRLAQVSNQCIAVASDAAVPGDFLPRTDADAGMTTAGHRRGDQATLAVRMTLQFGLTLLPRGDVIVRKSSATRGVTRGLTL
jgi:hypothetical protein